MRFEHWLIGVMIFLVAGVLGLIAASPDDVTVPKPTHTSIEVTESISISEPIGSAMPAPEFEDIPEMIVNEEPEVEQTSEVTEEISMLPASAEVNIPEGSGVPGCDETNECFIPSDVTVSVGDTVTWSNDDTAAHTVTSGTPADGPDGNFDSSLFMAGTTFEHTFDEAGTYDYFCMVHPWMKGKIQVS